VQIYVSVPLNSLEDIQLAANLAHARNVELMRRYGVPPLYESGVRYAREPRAPMAPPEERFDDPWVCMARGWGDCDDLAPWRSAEREVSEGLAPGVVYPVVVPTSTGAHVLVYDARDGSFEDPSRNLGMGAPWQNVGISSGL
jgi:hypothetical protein